MFSKSTLSRDRTNFLKEGFMKTVIFVFLALTSVSAFALHAQISKSGNERTVCDLVYAPITNDGASKTTELIDNNHENGFVRVISTNAFQNYFDDSRMSFCVTSGK
jgi:hypothetical protein